MNNPVDTLDGNWTRLGSAFPFGNGAFEKNRPAGTAKIEKLLNGREVPGAVRDYFQKCELEGSLTAERVEQYFASREPF